MVKRTKHIPVRQSSAYGLLWRTPMRKSITLLAATIAAVTGAITGVNAALPIIEPYRFPMWMTVVEHVEHRLAPVMMVQNTQAIAIDRFLLYQTQKELDQTKKDPAAKTSPVVQERIKSLDQQAKDTAERIHKATSDK